MTALVRPLQIWAHPVEKTRRLLVLRVSYGQAYGFGYHEHGSSTRDLSAPVDELATLWRLVEDTPAHLIPQLEARGVSA